MSDLVIKLERVFCEEITDDFLEGLTDELGWRLEASDGSGRTMELVDVPMSETSSVAPGQTYELDKEIARLPAEWSRVRLEFWDQDTFNEDDLLGTVHIERDGVGGVSLSAGATTEALEDGGFHLTGCNGDYTVWIDAREV